MNMVDLMWLFCGAFIGGLITLFFTAMLNASHENKSNFELHQNSKGVVANVCPTCGFMYYGVGECPRCASQELEELVSSDIFGNLHPAEIPTGTINDKWLIHRKERK